MTPPRGAWIRFLQWRWFYPIVRFLTAAGIALILFHFPLQGLEGNLYDFRVRLTPVGDADRRIQTIAIDNKTQDSLGRDINVSDYEKLLAQVAQDHPRSLVIFTNPSFWPGRHSDKLRFVQKAKSVDNLFFATEQVVPMTEKTHLRLSPPFDGLIEASAPITRDSISFAADKSTRRILLSIDKQLMLQPILANLENGIVNPSQYRGAYEHDHSIFTFLRYHPPGTFKPLSFIDVRDGRFPSGTFSGKFVLVGVDNQLNADDYIITPYSHDPLSMSKLEAQANILCTLLHNDGLIRVPTWLNLLLTLLVSYLTALIVWSAKPVQGIALLIAEVATFFGASVCAFCLFGVWIDMIHPLLTIGVAYYFFIPYRLIMENRRSWEYFQRNRLLIQVEELKSNFLSMMSHDLKTPIARIQGMAEIALTDSQNLRQHQREALAQIIYSSDELGHFISSILDLSRIESKEMKLNKASRDVNSLLREVVKRFEFLAAAKKISLALELEPLFSVRVDPDLIRQVFSNLIENALKYSPEGTNVKIKSYEKGGQVHVEVTDEGPGILPDEVDNVFQKFYRSRTAKASTVRGSGLGLYLAKYFVDLHDGDIEVRSFPQKGSTFTVRLPV